VDGGEGITSFTSSSIRDQISSDLMFLFLIDTAVTALVTNQKTRASLEMEIKLISAKTHHEEKQRACS